MSEEKNTAAEEVKADKTVEVPEKFEKLVSEIEKMSVLDLSELVKVLEDKFGVSAAAPMMMGAMPAAGGAASAGAAGPAGLAGSAAGAGAGTAAGSVVSGAGAGSTPPIHSATRAT